MDLLRIPIFALSISTSIASFCGQMLAFVAMPFYLEEPFWLFGRRDGAFDHAVADRGRLRRRPWPAGWSNATRPDCWAALGLVLFACGLGTLALMPADPDAVRRGLAHGAGGAGFGLFQTPNNRTMIAAAPRERSGGASGMLGTARLLGQTTGAALVALFLARYPTEGTQISLLVGVGFALLGAALSMLRLSEAGAKGGQAVRVLEAPRATEQR